MTTTVPDELTSLLLQVVDVDDQLITPDARFADLGQTSADELDLLIAIEDHYRIAVDFETFASLETVGELADAIAAATAPGGHRRLGAVRRRR
jgi:acyl carrier protein